MQSITHCHFMIAIHRYVISSQEVNRRVQEPEILSKSQICQYLRKRKGDEVENAGVQERKKGKHGHTTLFSKICEGKLYLFAVTIVWDYVKSTLKYTDSTHCGKWYIKAHVPFNCLLQYLIHFNVYVIGF